MYPNGNFCHEKKVCFDLTARAMAADRPPSVRIHPEEIHFCQRPDGKKRRKQIQRMFLIINKFLPECAGPVESQ